MKKFLTMLATTTAMAMPVVVQAQTNNTDVVVMRRTIAPPTRTVPTPTPTTTPTPTPTSTPTPTQTPTPTPTTTPTPTPTPTPDAARWVPSDWTYADSATCTDSARQTRTVTCQDGTAEVDVARCTAAKPELTQTVARTDGCTYAWTPIVYTPYDSSCADAATRTVTTPAICKRSDQKTETDETKCGTKPVPELTKAIYDSCTTDWVQGGFGNYSSTCSRSAVKTQTVQCQRFGGTSTAVVQDEALCTKTKPSTTNDPVDISTGCSYRWDTPSDWTTWTSTCSTTANRTRTVNCLRSDNTIETNQALCTAAKPSLSETGNLAGCVNSWQASGYGAYNSRCSAAASRTQTVTCQRSDGAPLPDASCDSATMPPRTDPTTVTLLDQCFKVDWAPGGYGPYSPSCSLTASRSQTVTCHAQTTSTDTGFDVPNSNCNNATKPDVTQTGVNTAGCTAFHWGTPSAWTNVGGSPQCSASVAQTRIVSCIRDLDGQGVNVSNCRAAGSGAGTEPISSQNAADYSNCTGTWVTGSTFTTTSACNGTTKTQTRDDRCFNTGANAYYSDISNCNPTTRPANYDQTVACLGTCSSTFLSNTQPVLNGSSATSAPSTSMSTLSGTALTDAAKAYCESATAIGNYKKLIGCWISSNASKSVTPILGGAGITYSTGMSTRVTTGHQLASCN